MNIRNFSVSSLALISVAACSSEGVSTSDSSITSGGGPPVVGSSEDTLPSGTAGSPTGGVANNGDGDGAPPGTGGALTTGGTGGSGAGGSPGSSGSGGGSSSSTPQPSAGCSGASPQSGARTIQVNGQTANYILSLPSDYDPNKPYPLGFAFHGFGRTHENCQQGDCAGVQSVMGQEAILIYMKSFTAGWELPDTREQNVDFFEEALDATLAEACIDENRVFVAGTSSGTHFTNILACRFGDRLLAAAPVAGYLPESEGCVGQVAAIPIHGIDDPHVTFSSGETARDFYLSQNGCGSSTTPDLATMHAEIRASRDAGQTNQACVDYQGCDSGFPVRWCEHSEGGYDNSTHGWPTAGGQMIWDFVSAL